MLARIIIAVHDRFWSFVKTAAARSQARLGSNTRLGAEGRVINIAGRRDAIRIGASGIIRGEVLTFAHAGRIEIGDWCYLGPQSSIWSSNGVGVKIGHRVLISHSVAIHDTDSHPLDPQKRFAQSKAILTSGHPRDDPGIRSAPVIIGDDVWIGMGVVIMKGVTIGDRAVIGARAIVKTNVPADGYVPSSLSEPRQ